MFKATRLLSNNTRTTYSRVQLRENCERLKVSSSAACATARPFSRAHSNDATTTSNDEDKRDEPEQTPSEATSQLSKIERNRSSDLRNSRDVSRRADSISSNERQRTRCEPVQSHQSSQTGQLKGSEATDPYLDLKSNQEWTDLDAHTEDHNESQQHADAAGGNKFRSSFFAVPKLSKNSSDKPEVFCLPDTSLARPKVDLSYQNVRDREAAAMIDGKATALYSQSSSFRSKTGLRRIVATYMQHIENYVPRSILEAEHQKDIDNQVLRVFTNETLTYLHEHGYTVEDVVSLSWIFSAGNINLSIYRYVVLSQERRRRGYSPTPIFVPLQLLRASNIDTHSLSLFIGEIYSDLNTGCRWDQDSGPVLLIRLLRSARNTEVSFFEQIVDLAPRVVPLVFGKHTNTDAERLTHFYNRFLSLLALPASRHPYLSAGFQQRAQLKIVKLIMQSDLPISVNREGYRALTKVQQLHSKTIDEQKWSGVKAPSWPPWRIDDLGIDSMIEYPGRHSRVSKVLKRFLEAGYGPASAEEEAQILAGWDTDKSPTIQVRRIVKRHPLSWIKKVFKKDSQDLSMIDHSVWAARVAATRSIREAWVCFYSYMDATEQQKRSMKVYHEMFFKLFARTQESDQRLVPSPGDGREVFADPVSSRDLVYVPKEPPSLNELYAQMLQDGIRPAGRLLAGLVSNANTLKEGLSYIANSSLDDVKKDVLLHPEKYPSNATHHTFSRIPDYILSSYIGILTRQISGEGVQLYEPGSRSSDEPTIMRRDECTPLQCGITLLKIWKPTYLPAYHAVLHGLYTHSMAKEPTKEANALPKASIGELWEAAQITLQTLEHQGLTPDLECFRKVMMLVRNLIIRAPRQLKDTRINVSEMVQVPISLFTQAVWEQKSGIKLLPSGKDIKIWRQPYWKDIENLLLMLGLTQDFPSITEVLRWMSDEHEHLACVDGGGYKMQRIMCAARCALEGTWALKKSRCASREQINQAIRYAERWGWPEDVDVQEFLQQHWTWLKNAARHL